MVGGGATVGAPFDMTTEKELWAALSILKDLREILKNEIDRRDTSVSEVAQEIGMHRGTLESFLSGYTDLRYQNIMLAIGWLISSRDPKGGDESVRG